MKRLFAIFCAAVLLFCGCSIKVVDKEEMTEEREGERLAEGEEFLLHDYIVQDGVTIRYFGYEDGEAVFTISNPNRHSVTVSCWVVDGNGDIIGNPFISSYDLLDDNHPAQMIASPDGMLLHYYGFNISVIDLDPDKDGYYDIIFNTTKVEDDGTMSFTKDSYVRPAYRLKAE